jgi:cation transport regulator ChaB
VAVSAVGHEYGHRKKKEADDHSKEKKPFDVAVFAVEHEYGHRKKKLM